LEGRRRQINEKVENAVRECLRMRGSDFNRDVSFKFAPTYDK